MNISNFRKTVKSACTDSMNYIVYTFIFVGALAGITALWQIAEKIIEGQVVPSSIDTFVAIILATILSNNIIKYVEIKK